MVTSRIPPAFISLFCFRLRLIQVSVTFVGKKVLPPSDRCSQAGSVLIKIGTPELEEAGRGQKSRIGLGRARELTLDKTLRGATTCSIGMECTEEQLREHEESRISVSSPNQRRDMRHSPFREKDDALPNHLHLGYTDPIPLRQNIPPDGRLPFLLTKSSCLHMPSSKIIIPLAPNLLQLFQFPFLL
jgi:hypothetical protein